jgi:hypothetical protein
MHFYMHSYLHKIFILVKSGCYRLTIEQYRLLTKTELTAPLAVRRYLKSAYQ